MQESSLQTELIREIDAEIEQTLADARRDAEALRADARRRREALQRDTLRRLDEELAVERRRALARAEQEGRNALLRLKREETDRVFADASERLVRMEAEEPDAFLQLMVSIFRSCRRLLPSGPLRVRTGMGKESLCERLNCEDGIDAVIDPDLRGMVLETVDGRLHCDGSIAGLLNRLRQERAAEIEGILFGDGHGREG